MYRRGGFSLLELTIVLVVLGLVAAIAVPRLSRAGAGAADAALEQDLATLRRAAECYAAEHCGTYPSVTTFREQLRRYTDASGAVSKDRVGRYQFGPYVRDVPAVAAGPSKGSSRVAAERGPGVGWIYDEAAGQIRVNAGDQRDSLGRRYADY
jgi:prepilin-type N-terminal cleavage/methylation domain-containing protein